MKITDRVTYIGVNDHNVDLFEGQYVVPNGMAYNSYVVKAGKIAVFDTVGEDFADEWFRNMEAAMKGREPDYLIVQHMEPDHSASIHLFAKKFPNAVIVASMPAFTMMNNYFGTDFAYRRKVIKEGESLDLGGCSLNFIAAPMVHWPEVMMTYMPEDKILFSADGFGKFGALDVEEDWACEARRYYIGIVGRFGLQVQNVLKKAANLDIATICPLHGPVLTENLGYYLDLYDKWSSYTPETEGVAIAYTSVYGHTKEAVLKLAEMLKARGIKVSVTDLARGDWAEAVEDAFRYDRLVLATTTYNAGIFPFMETFIHHLTERNFQNRTVALIENGSWAPNAARVMTDMLEDCKRINFLPGVTIKAALNDESTAKLESLADTLCGEACKVACCEKVKKYACKVCGYVHEGDMPEGFTCPLCRRPASEFEEL